MNIYIKIKGIGKRFGSKDNLVYNFFFFGFEETPPPGKRTLWAQVSE